MVLCFTYHEVSVLDLSTTNIVDSGLSLDISKTLTHCIALGLSFTAVINMSRDIDSIILLIPKYCCKIDGLAKYKQDLASSMDICF
jgi:hypothetical protein